VKYILKKVALEWRFLWVIYESKYNNMHIVEKGILQGILLFE